MRHHPMYVTLIEQGLEFGIVAKVNSTTNSCSNCDDAAEYCFVDDNSDHYCEDCCHKLLTDYRQ